MLPVYNGETYLETALDSVLAQTLENFELIVIDDGSTDGTPRILKAFSARDERVIVIRQPQGGIVRALNAGLRIAKGEYLARMDADDVSLPSRFQFQTEYLAHHPECVIVGGYAETFNDNQPIVGITTGGWRARTDLNVFPPKIAVSVHPLIMMRTADLRVLKGYREGYPFAEDYDLFIRASRYGEIHNPPKIVLRYRSHPGSVSAQKTETQEWAALAAEFDALNLKLPLPPRTARITHPASERTTAGVAVGAQVTHAYFWFRVWRRRRGAAGHWSALSHFLPFLVGLQIESWGSRFGLPLRARMMSSFILHSTVGSLLRLRFRRLRAAALEVAEAA